MHLNIAGGWYDKSGDDTKMVSIRHTALAFSHGASEST